MDKWSAWVSDDLNEQGPRDYLKGSLLSSAGFLLSSDLASPLSTDRHWFRVSPPLRVFPHRLRTDRWREVRRLPAFSRRHLWPVRLPERRHRTDRGPTGPPASSRESSTGHHPFLLWARPVGRPSSDRVWGGPSQTDWNRLRPWGSCYPSVPVWIGRVNRPPYLARQRDPPPRPARSHHHPLVRRTGLRADHRRRQKAFRRPWWPRREPLRQPACRR